MRRNKITVKKAFIQREYVKLRTQLKTNKKTLFKKTENNDSKHKTMTGNIPNTGAKLRTTNITMKRVNIYIKQKT